MYSKTLTLFLISTVFSNFLFAQQPSADDTTWKTNCLFSTFVPGQVLLKDGSIEEAQMNYNAYNQSIVFLNGSKIMELSNLDNVDTVYMANRRYVADASKVFEFKGSDNGAGLYTTYLLTREPMTNTVNRDGGSTVPTSRENNTLTGAYVTQRYKGEFTYYLEPHFWLMSRNRYYPIDSERQFLKRVRSEHLDATREFIEKNKIDFNSEADLLKLLAYAQIK